MDQHSRETHRWSKQQAEQLVHWSWPRDFNLCKTKTKKSTTQFMTSSVLRLAALDLSLKLAISLLVKKF